MYMFSIHLVLYTCTFTNVLYTHYVHFMYMYIYKCTVHSLCTLYIHVHLRMYCTLIMYTLCTCTFTSVLYTHYVQFMYMYIYKCTVHFTVALNKKFPYSKRTTHVQLAYYAVSTLRYVRSLYSLRYVYAHITNNN